MVTSVLRLPAHWAAATAVAASSSTTSSVDDSRASAESNDNLPGAGVASPRVSLAASSTHVETTERSMASQPSVRLATTSGSKSMRGRSFRRPPGPPVEGTRGGRGAGLPSGSVGGARTAECGSVMGRL